MSALPNELPMDGAPGESASDKSDKSDNSDNSDQAAVAGTPVVVRRNAGLAALIGAGASAISIGYLWRATQSGTLVDWGLCLVMATIAGFYLTNLVDSRTPLVVADDLGVRIRLGSEWRGLPWEAVNQVVIEPRKGPLRDGRLVFLPRSLGRALDGLEVRGRRQARLNQKLYGAALAVPLGLTTRTSTHGERGLEEGIAALALGRADVMLVEPTPDSEAPATSLDPLARVLDRAVPGAPDAPVEDEPADAVADEDDAPDDEPDTELETEPGSERRSTMRPLGMLGGLGTVVSRVAKGRNHDVDSPFHDPELTDDDATDTTEKSPEPPVPAIAAVALRATRPALRAEITRDTPAALLNPTPPDGAEDDVPRTEGRELHRPGSVDLVIEAAGPSRVRPISQLGDAVEPLVIDDYVTEPAYDPVIGPELAAARNRLGLSVDELADRTRIRPHVIESIEVDDFAPCGGDFYARGHLRTLARVLGKDAAPMLEQFDNRYAHAPINARRVFEAELATGMTGSMRSTIGGPSWGLLVGVVLVLVLVWGLVRLFAGQPVEQVQSPAPVLNGSGGVSRSFDGYSDPVAKPVRVSLTATQSDSHVLVRDGSGKVVYTGLLALGETKSLAVTPPVHVSARNAGAVDVHLAGKDRGPVGTLGQHGHRTFHRPPTR